MQTNGHVFFELYVVDLESYVTLFRDAFGMAVVEDDDDFVKLTSSHGTVMLNAIDELPEGHPFRGFKGVAKRGFGVELGVVIDELEQAHARARALFGDAVTDITHQSWGMSDFRVQTKEGFFVRATTSDPDERR